MTRDTKLAAWVGVENAVAVQEGQRFPPRVRDAGGYRGVVHMNKLHFEGRALPRSSEAQSRDSQKLQYGSDGHGE